MKKILKYSGIVIGVLLALLILAAIILPLVINPNDYKGRISDYVHNKTGRELSISGDIKLSVFPWLGVNIGKLELSNAPGFGQTPFAAIREADVHVKLLPLITGKVEVGTIHLDGLQLNLARNAGGRDNWSDLAGNSKSKSAPAGGKGSGLAGLTVAGIEISDGALRFTDAAKHKSMELAHLNLDMGAFRSGNSFPLSLGFDYATTNPQITGKLHFEGKLNLDLQNQRYRVNDAKLEVNGSGSPIPFKQLDGSLQWQRADVDMLKGVLAVDALTLDAEGLTAHAKIRGSSLNHKPVFSGSGKLETFSPRKLLAKLKKAPVLKTADPAALGRAALEFDFSAGSNSARLSKILMVLDDSTITGNLAVGDFKTGKIDFNLDVNSLDADRYLPPPAKRPAGSTPTGAGIDRIRLPVHAVRALAVNGKLHVTDLKAMNIRSSNIRLGISANAGLVHVHPISASLYGGTYSGDVTYDARTDTPSLSMNETLKGVQIGGLLKDLANAKRLSGTTDAHAKLTGKGKTVGDLRRSLDGNVGFALKNGAIEGINLWAAIRAAYSAYKGLPQPSGKQPARTEFAQMSATGKVTDGIMENRDLAASLPFIRVNGKGKLDLVKQTVDYHLLARVIKTPEVKQAEKLNELKGVQVPLKVYGSFSDLSVVPDIAGALKAKIKSKAQQEINKEREKLRKKAEEKLKQILKPPPHINVLNGEG